VLLLAAHMRWSADAFGVHALPACRGLDAGLHGDRGVALIRFLAHTHRRTH